MNPLPPLSNPYPSPRHSISCRVSPADFHYYRTLFHFNYGLTDALLSTLFHHVISELRAAGISPSNDEHVSYGPDSGALPLLQSIVQRCTTGGHSTEASAQDDGRGASPVCPCDGAATQLGTEPQSRDESTEGKEREVYITQAWLAYCKEKGL